MKHSDNLVAQTARANSMKLSAIITLVAGVALLVASFVIYAQSYNIILSTVALLAGTVFLGIGSKHLDKAKNLRERADYGIISF